jgi:hypothetical protein
MYLFSYVSLLVAWISYLYSHYSVTGTLIEDKAGEKDLEAGDNLTFISYGTLLWAAGMISVIYFLSRSMVIPSYLSTMTVLIGYSLIHYGTTGKVV